MNAWFNGAMYNFRVNVVSESLPTISTELPRSSLSCSAQNLNMLDGSSGNSMRRRETPRVRSKGQAPEVNDPQQVHSVNTTGHKSQPRRSTGSNNNGVSSNNLAVITGVPNDESK